ncbi:MAG: P-II family nitrogen regulator [Acholeplasmatales bacterium]|nr:P-II family nitrogen regulator [Acholeplasmatales bacterium]
MDKRYELVVCIVNKGFNEQVMIAAKNCGAKGGTVINARGTAKEDVAKRFDYIVTPEKEIVLLVVPFEIKDQILHALYQEVGLQTPGQGIIFTVPVDETAGIGKKSAKNEKAEEVSYEEYNKAKAEEIEKLEETTSEVQENVEEEKEEN